MRKSIKHNLTLRRVREHFAFSARIGPNGPSGFARIETPSFTVQGHVTCYTVNSANESTFGIQIEQSSGMTCPFCQGFVFRVIDNGNPGQQVTPDFIGTGFQVLVPIGTCPDQGAGTPVTNGNITVKNP